MSHRLLSSLIGVLAACAVAVLFLRPSPESLARDLGAMSEDELVRFLAHSVDGGFDSHPDPDVGRLLLPGIEKRIGMDGLVRSNSWGLREGEIPERKPAGERRVVLLGDSLVFGKDVEAEERMGVHLERRLKAATGEAWRVLHVGISAWNLHNEVAYLRRRLDSLEPELVVHVTTHNDLDDGLGVRGFGGLARFAPERRGHANGFVGAYHPFFRGEHPSYNFLLFGEDHESRTRLAEGRRAIADLAELLEGEGIGYVHVLHWMKYNASIGAALLPESVRESGVRIRDAFARDVSTWISATNAHWNASGMERIGAALYDVIRTRLSTSSEPELPLDREARRAAASLFEPIPSEPPAERVNGHWLDLADGRFELAGLKDYEGYHVYGGLDEEGYLAPYASFALASPRATAAELRVQGERLRSPSLRGASARVLVEGEEVGVIALGGDESIDVTFPCPGTFRGALVNVQLVADDWIHAPFDPRACIAMRLERLELAPRSGVRDR